jgi:phosphoglycolate phosphatase
MTLLHNGTGAPIEAVFFDLDGVIVDSLPDIAAAVNAVIAKNGYSVLTVPVIQTLVGQGAHNLIFRALETSALMCGKHTHDPTGEEFERIYRDYLEYYRANSVDKTVLYPGVLQLLDICAGRDIPAAIVSNKPCPVTHEVLKRLHIDSYFLAVTGPELVSKAKPDPESLEYAFAVVNAARKEAGKHPVSVRGAILMAGDTDTDIQAGRAFGAQTCAVTGGYGNPEKLLAEKADYEVTYVSEIAALLNR